ERGHVRALRLFDARADRAAERIRAEARVDGQPHQALASECRLEGEVARDVTAEELRAECRELRTRGHEHALEALVKCAARGVELDGYVREHARRAGQLSDAG